MSAAPVPCVSNPVAVRARQRKDSVTVTTATPGHPDATGQGPAALALLHDRGARVTAGSWRTLVRGDTTTLPALLTLARTASRDGSHAATWPTR